MRQSPNQGLHRILHSAPRLLGCVLLFLTLCPAWAEEARERMSESPLVLSNGCYIEKFSSFTAHINDDANESSALLLEFFSALAWQECAAQTQGLQRKKMLEEAASSYTSYLASRPKDTDLGAVYNLAKTYQELDDIDQAVKYYDIAIAIKSEYQQDILLVYAKFLDNIPRRESASKVYLELARKYPLTQGQQETLGERFADQGLNELADFLWVLIDQGGSSQTLNIALKHLKDSTDKSDKAGDLQTEILTIITVALSRLNFDPMRYETVRSQLLALSGKPAIAGGIDEIVKLQDIAVHILSELDTVEPLEGDVCKVEDQHQKLLPSEYPWWRTVHGKTNRAPNPKRGVWPADGFRALVVTLGIGMRQTAEQLSLSDRRSFEYFRFAESYFRLAADLRAGEVDPSAVVELVGLKIETDQLVEVERILGDYDGLIKSENRNTTSEAQLKKSFSYHQAMGGWYTNLSDAGYADNTAKAVLELEEARAQNKRLELDANSPEELPWHLQFTPEMVDMLADGYGDSAEKIADLRIEQAKRYQNAGHPCTALEILVPFNGFGELSTTTRDSYQDLQDVLTKNCESANQRINPPPPPPPDPNYIGDDIRLSIGYTSETDLTGEFLWNFLEDSDSAVSFEAWKGNESSGGLKLNYHWLADGKVRKLFIAADQNVYSDGKLTFGGGSEHEDRFWSLYGSKSITGERAIDQSSNTETFVQESFFDNHVIIQTDTLTTTTDFMAHPYDWGVGFRVGRFYENSLVRLRGGFDYEDGDYSSYQLTAYASLDKRFRNSSQGLSFRAEVVRKNGDFEVDKNDLRLSAFWSWDFGKTFRSVPASPGYAIASNPTPAAQSTNVTTHGVAQTEDEASGPANESMSEFQVTVKDAGFALGSYSLTEEAKSELVEFVESTRDSEGNSRVVGDIQVIGHTCSLGGEEYNQVLSESRAETTKDFLSGKFGTNTLLSKGRGERDPRYSNCSEETRSKNRRVEITFTTEKMAPPSDQKYSAFAADFNENQVSDAEPYGDAAKPEASWIRRALRNPASHKRTVDYYRYDQVTENNVTEISVINSGPEAMDDSYGVQQDSVNNDFYVLENDSDAESDNLRIVSVSSPAHGTATINGDTVLYTPDPGYFGEDSFSYEIEDIYVTVPHPPGESSTAQVTIQIMPSNRPPDAMDDNYTIPKNTYDQPLNVLENDSDPDGDAISIIEVGTPTNGTVTFTGELILYTPNPEFIGTDHFEYTIEDGNGGEDTALVTVDVVNQAPVAVDDFAETWKNNSVTIDVLANDYDPDGDTITIVDIIQDEHPMGTVTDNGNGTLTYIPMKGWFGGDEFQYTISDGDLTSTATVIIDVKWILRNQ
jgi:outer membrane protein OmpA-like peptidoglycan-associated protein/tetratricopeptide (TPR) repeat protein